MEAAAAAAVAVAVAVAVADARPAETADTANSRIRINDKQRGSRDNVRDPRFFSFATFSLEPDGLRFLPSDSAAPASTAF